MSPRPVINDFSFLVSRLLKVLKTFEVDESGQLKGDPDDCVRVFYRGEDEAAWRRIPIRAATGEGAPAGHYRAELLSGPEDASPPPTVLREIVALLKPPREEEQGSPIAYVRASALAVENVHASSASLRESNIELRNELREERDEGRQLRERLREAEHERDTLRNERQDESDFNPGAIIEGLRVIFGAGEAEAGSDQETAARVVVEVVRQDPVIQKRLAQLGFAQQLRVLGCGEPPSPAAPEQGPEGTP